MFVTLIKKKLLIPCHLFLWSLPGQGNFGLALWCGEKNGAPSIILVWRCSVGNEDVNRA
jgi:hypothetical protein